ncbi:clathrin adaptor complex [Purpureocillium lilacinum]|uniref:Coatomer subunit zeta n=3 Tax=Purpureocillium lilacinum TaxID=33203 RepID=A0A2U3EI78_PURLI|nr:clathrin adaptor complex [Purpureocillium lilacinum]
MTEVAATATAPPAAAAPHLTCDVVEATSASITTTSHPRARKPPPFAAHPPAATMSPGMTLFSVQAVLILSTEDGSRIFAKYYSPPHSTASAAGGASSSSNPYPDLKAQKAFEKGLIDKTAKQTGDIILYDNRIVLYKLESDVMIYVVGSLDENEILLYNTVLALRDSLHLLFKQSVDKRTIIENYDLVSLAIDEVVDDGIILETDPTIIVQRVSRAPTQDVPLGRIDLSEQGVNNLAQLGKSKLADWLRQGL